MFEDTHAASELNRGDTFRQKVVLPRSWNLDRGVRDALSADSLVHLIRIYLAQPVLWLIPALFCAMHAPPGVIAVCWTVGAAASLISSRAMQRARARYEQGEGTLELDSRMVLWLGFPAISVSAPLFFIFPSGDPNFDVILVLTLVISLTVVAGVGTPRGSWLAAATGPQAVALTIGILEQRTLSSLAFAAFLMFYVTVCFVLARAVREDRGRQIETRRRLAEALADARAANTAKSKFLAAMSHELRTPLNAILGFSEVIATQTLGPVGSVKYLEYAKDIHFSGNHLLNLINDVLDLAKIEAGKIEIDRQMLDPCSLLEAAIRMTTPRAQAGGVKLDSAIETRDLVLFADERAATQALLNVVTNAVKFNQPGGTVHVELTRSTAGGVRFVVRDDGPGIPADQIDRLFEPFEQGENGYSKGKNGTGLGLAIVRSLMKVHGGHVWIESQVGEGTTVYLEFPHGGAAELPELDERFASVGRR